VVGSGGGSVGGGGGGDVESTNFVHVRGSKPTRPNLTHSYPFLTSNQYYTDVFGFTC